MQRENGVLIGTVFDNVDPEQIGRVRVRFPQYNDQQSDWSRVVAPMAGKDRGVFFQPEIGDEVLVVCENGDPRRAYVVGGLWSKTDTPPARDNNDAQNNWRFIKSRSGHIVKLDYTAGSEKIEIIDKTGNHKIVIDSNGKIEIVCSVGDLSLSAPAGTFKIDAQKIEISATTELSVEATGNLTVKGAMVNIN